MSRWRSETKTPYVRRRDLQRTEEEKAQSKRRLFYGFCIFVVGFTLVATAFFGSGRGSPERPAISVPPISSLSVQIAPQPSPGTALQIAWNSGQTTIQNYTVRVGFKGCYHWTLFPSTSSTITYSTGIQSETLYCVEVAEWFSGTMSNWSAGVSAVTGNFYPNLSASAAPPPTGLYVASFTATTITVAWTNPFTTVSSYALDNDTIYYGSTCGNWTNSVSLGGVYSSDTLTLSTGSYCFTVQVWSPDMGSVGPGGGSAFSGILVGSIGGIIGLGVTSQTNNSVLLGWTNPVGVTVQNVTVQVATSIALLGTSYGQMFSAGATAKYNVTNLHGSTLYLFRVYATVLGLSTPYSNVVGAITGGVVGSSPPGGGGGGGGGGGSVVVPPAGPGVAIPIPGTNSVLNLPFVVVGAIAALGGFLVVLTTNPAGNPRYWGFLLVGIGIFVAILGAGTITH